MVFSHLGAFGYATGFHAGTGAGWTYVSGIGVDSYGPAADPQTVGILVDGSAYASTFEGGFIGPFGEAVRINSTYTPDSAQKFSGISIGAASGDYTIGIMDGSALFAGDAFRGGTLYLADGAGTLYLSGNEPGTILFTPESPADAASVYNGGAPIAGLTNIIGVTGSFPNRGTTMNNDIGGLGSFTLNVHNGTTAGGNAAGSNATDLQTTRNAATQVASGGGSFEAGQENTASGGNSFVGGFANTVSGLGGAAFGYNNQVSGTVSSIPGGYFASDRGRYGVRCQASGRNVLTGDAQTCVQVMRMNTTSTTATRLTADGGAPGSANCVNIPNSTHYGLDIEIDGLDITIGGGSVTWRETTAFMNQIANVVNVTNVSTPITGSSGTGSSAVISAPAADSINQCLNLTVQAPNADTWHWTARVVTTEVQ